MSEELISQSSILLVEDEENLALGLEYNLTEEGYKVTLAKDGREALNKFDEKEFDLIVLDIMLPYHDGFEIAEHIRKKYPQMPILMLTARTQAEDRVKGLEIGADDYLTKPFHLKELLLRIKGMLKRKSWYRKVVADTPLYRFGNNEINFENLKCKNIKGEFQLTPYEAMIMKYMIDNKDKVISRPSSTGFSSAIRSSFCKSSAIVMHPGYRCRTSRLIHWTRLQPSGKSPPGSPFPRTFRINSVMSSRRPST